MRQEDDEKVKREFKYMGDCKKGKQRSGDEQTQPRGGHIKLYQSS
jgi:hypothetical protein